VKAGRGGAEREQRVCATSLSASSSSSSVPFLSLAPTRTPSSRGPRNWERRAKQSKAKQTRAGRKKKSMSNETPSLSFALSLSRALSPALALTLSRSHSQANLLSGSSATTASQASEQRHCTHAGAAKKPRNHNQSIAPDRALFLSTVQATAVSSFFLSPVPHSHNNQSMREIPRARTHARIDLPCVYTLIGTNFGRRGAHMPRRARPDTAG